MNLYDEKIIVAIEDAIQNMVEASGITADVFRLDGDRVIDALLQALGDEFEYVVVPVDQAKDAERLDFMLQENMVVSTDINWDENFERTGEGFCVNAVYWIDGWYRLTSTVHQTKREAIDAAMVEAARGRK